MLRSFILIVLCVYFSAPAFGVVRKSKPRQVRPAPVHAPAIAPAPYYAPTPVVQKPRRFYQNFYFNVGNHTDFYNGVQNNDSGDLRKITFAPVVGVGVTIPSYYGFNFFPEFNWVLPKLIEDSNIIVNTLMFRFDAAYDIVEGLRLRVGTSIMHQNQHGRGGNSTQRNGNSTSTFFYPDENRSSFNNTLDLGAEAVLARQFGLRFQTYTYSVFLAEKRQISYTLFLTYYLD